MKEDKTAKLKGHKINLTAPLKVSDYIRTTAYVPDCSLAGSTRFLIMEGARLAVSLFTLFMFMQTYIQVSSYFLLSHQWHGLCAAYMSFWAQMQHRHKEIFIRSNICRFPEDQ